MNILITGALQDSDYCISRLEELGYVVKFIQYENDELNIAYDWPEVVICNNLFFFHDIKKFSNLKVIQLTSTGTDRVPIEYIKQNKIKLFTAKDVYSIPISEYVICGVLQLYKKSFYFYKSQKVHLWEKNRSLMELYGKTVCIVGCGGIGRQCALKFKAFGCNVIGVRNQNKSVENFDKIYTSGNLKTALQQSDIIVICIPLTKMTKYLFNEEMFQYIKDDSIIVNVSRGSIIKQDALEYNIDRLYGAVLDVFENEPLDKNSILWDKDNVIITPHNSFIGDGNILRLHKRIILNLKGAFDEYR